LGGCRSTDAPTPIDSIVSLNVEKVSSTVIPNHSNTQVSLDVVFKNKSDISITPVLCSYLLQRDGGATVGFVTVGSVECQASSSWTGSPIPPLSEGRYTFLFSVAPNDLKADSNYRLNFQVFLEGTRASQSLNSSSFAIPLL
jgi:hypothetical protein